MSRFSNGLLTAFRIVQLFLSLVVLACGSYIVYEMVSMAQSARNIANIITTLEDPTERQSLEDTLGPLFTDLGISDADLEDIVNVLNKFLLPPLHVLEGTPTRAIIITAVAFLSIIAIIYVFVAHKKGEKHRRMNSRAARITAEVLTLILWLIGIVCAGLLASEYAGFVVTGGIETREAFDAIKTIIEAALETLVSGGSIARALDIVNEILTIGAMSIITLTGACVCATISLFSCTLSCCMSGKPKETIARHENEAAVPFVRGFEKTHPIYPTYTEISSPNSWQIPRKPVAPAPMTLYYNYPNTGYIHRAA